MNHAANKRKIRIESKRNVELWIYSFADMYMILSVFFIALSVIYAAKVKNPKNESFTPSAGRGPASIQTELQLTFDKGSAALSEQSKEEMGLILPALKQLRHGFVEVEGYADGSPLNKKTSGFSSNLDLSNQRAVTVAEWLISQGVSARRIRTFSYGDGFQWNGSGVPSNRRVLIKVTADSSNK